MKAAPVHGVLIAKSPRPKAPDAPTGMRSGRRLKYSLDGYQSLREAWAASFGGGNYENRLDLLRSPAFWADESLLILARTLQSVEGRLTRLRQQVGESVELQLQASLPNTRSHKRKARPEYCALIDHQTSDSRSCIALDCNHVGKMLALLSEPQAWTPGYLTLVRQSLRVLEGRVARMRSQVERARKQERAAEEAARRALGLFPDRFDPDEQLDEARMLYPDFP